MKHLLTDITAAELKEKITKNENFHLLDVREELEYHTFNIGGENIPLSTFSQNLENLGYNKADEIVVICQRGLRSETAGLMLLRSGFRNVKNLHGGLLAYRKIIL